MSRVSRKPVKASAIQRARGAAEFSALKSLSEDDEAMLERTGDPDDLLPVTAEFDADAVELVADVRRFHCD